MCDSYRHVDKHLEVKNLRIINGAQTTRSIARALEKNKMEEQKKYDLKNVYILFKLVKLNKSDDANEDLSHKIIRTSNLQNQIKPSDFLVHDKVQLAFEKGISDFKFTGFGAPHKKIFYKRKRGEKNPGNKYKQIDLETATKLFAAYYISPKWPRTSNELWDKDKGHYEKIYGKDDVIAPSRLKEMAAVINIWFQINKYLDDKKTLLKESDNKKSNAYTTTLSQWFFPWAFGIFINNQHKGSKEKIFDLICSGKHMEPKYFVKNDDPSGDDLNFVEKWYHKIFKTIELEIGRQSSEGDGFIQIGIEMKRQLKF